ncbi:MAG: TIGR04283 family arsenosugar biosynthesis glycosyltransferase [Cyclobacteriaceae bacterium]
MHQLSVIIPTLNEALCLRRTLEHLARVHPSPFEVIIVDGGSTDQTAEIAAEFNTSCIKSDKPGRSIQMNIGANAAQGDLLCFLHADTLVPNKLVEVICKTLQEQHIVLAGFNSVMGDAGKVHRFTTWLNFSKTYFAPMLYRPYHCLFKGLRLLFGDQVMFCRKADFLKAGGFNEQLPIMEEADLCLRMNRLGRIRQVSEKVYTSDRRIARWGFWKAHSLYVGICLLWALRVSPHWLKKFYEEVR